MKELRRGFACLTCLLVLLVAATVSAADPNPYLPLELGYYWEYQLPTGTETRTVDRHVEIDADLIFAIVTTGTTANAGLEEYWNNGTTVRHEDARLYGYHHTVDDTGRIYDPPLTMAKKDLDVCDNWHDDDVRIYLQPGNVLLGRYDFDHVVQDTATVVTPAGTFLQVGIATTIAPHRGGAPRPCDPTGRSSARAGSRAGKTWWARSTGEVGWEVDGGTAQLIDYDVQNPVESSSWGRIKSLYR